MVRARWGCGIVGGMRWACVAAGQLWLASQAVGGAPSPLGQTVAAVEHRLGPRSDREDCFLVEAETRIAYAFEFTGAVEFNLHHHRGEETFYDVAPSQAERVEAELVLPDAGEYCLMYRNLDAGYSTVRGSYRRVVSGDRH